MPNGECSEGRRGLVASGRGSRRHARIGVRRSPSARSESLCPQKEQAALALDLVARMLQRLLEGFDGERELKKKGRHAKRRRGTRARGRGETCESNVRRRATRAAAASWSLTNALGKKNVCIAQTLRRHCTDVCMDVCAGVCASTFIDMRTETHTDGASQRAHACGSDRHVCRASFPVAYAVRKSADMREGARKEASEVHWCGEERTAGDCRYQSWLVHEQHVRWTHRDAGGP